MREGWIAVFDDPGRARDALRALKALGVKGMRVASPAAYPIVHETGQPGPWRAMGWLALGGGLCGLTLAISLEVGTSLLHPMHVGGQPVVAWVQFGVIMFELTMLGAGLTNFLAMVLLGALSRRRVARGARDAVLSDRLAITVPAAGHSPEQLAAMRRALVGALAVNEAP